MEQAFRGTGIHESAHDLGLRLEVMSGQVRSIAIRRSKTIVKTVKTRRDEIERAMKQRIL